MILNWVIAILFITLWIPTVIWLFKVWKQSGQRIKQEQARRQEREDYEAY